MKAEVKNHNELKEKIVPELIKEFIKDPSRKAPWSRFCNSWQIQANVPELNLQKYIKVLRQ